MGDRSLNKGKLFGIAGGVGVFIIFILLLVYLNSDFDRQLINKMKSGVSNENLKLQIEAESGKEKKVVFKHLQSHINDVECWSKTDIVSKEDFEFEINNYKMKIQTIDDCENLRKQYINHEISEDYYIDSITYIKGRLET